jgi:hypothetical protein
MTGNNQSKLDIVQEASKIARAVWVKTDFDSVSSSRSLDDEFASRISTASYTGSVSDFVNKLCSKWGIRSIDDEEVLEIVKKYDSGESDVTAREFLRVVRSNSALVVLEMKNNGD